MEELSAKLSPKDAERLVTLWRTAVRRGQRMAPALARLREELRHADAFAAERRRLTRIAAFRLALAATFALGARAFLSEGSGIPTQPVDVALSALAVTVAIAFQISARRLLPTGWFRSEHITPGGWAWLEASFGDRAVAPAVLLSRLEALRAEEVRRGVSTRLAREELLQDHAEHRRAEDRHALQKVEAAWPLAELVGIGLPVLLLLAAPARALLEF